MFFIDSRLCSSTLLAKLTKNPTSESFDVDAQLNRTKKILTFPCYNSYTQQLAKPS